MKNPNLAKWDTKEELGGLLFFAQSVSDMLFDYTLDTYKVPSLNTNNINIEGLIFAKLIKANHFSAIVLDPIIEEFVFNFKKDPIMKSIYGKKIDQYVKYLNDNKNKKIDINEVENIFKLIINQSRSNYLTEIKRQLNEFVSNKPRKKEIIEELVRSFLTELIYLGYSRSYIYYMTNQFFFEGSIPEKINNCKQIADYFEILT